MKHALRLVCVFAFAGLAPVAHAQPVGEPRHIGERIGGTVRLDAAKGAEEDTVTLSFVTSDDPLIYTIDFVTRHPIQQPVAASGVVDMIVTQRPRDDEAPQMTLTLDGGALPLVTRLYKRRSIVASISLDDFDRIASSEHVADRAFGVLLEFSPVQVKMLRHTADRWLGRVR